MTDGHGSALMDTMNTAHQEDTMTTTAPTETTIYDPVDTDDDTIVAQIAGALFVHTAGIPRHYYSDLARDVQTIAQVLLPGIRAWQQEMPESECTWTWYASANDTGTQLNIDPRHGLSRDEVQVRMTVRRTVEQRPYGRVERLVVRVTPVTTEQVQVEALAERMGGE